MAMELMNVDDIAKYLNLSTRTVYSMVKKGEIPHIKVGGQYRFIESEIEGWIRKKATGLEVGLEKVKTTKDPLAKRLLFMGILTKELKKMEVTPIVVGGNAVEFYTAGGYATGDIDVVAPSEPINEVLSKWGFEREGRHWFSEELDIAIEAPSSSLGPNEQKEKLVEVEIEGLKVYIIGIEDLIIDRLNAYVHWKSIDDKAWAKELVTIHRDEIDWKYIKKRTADEKSSKGLNEIKKELKIDEKS